MKRGRPRRDPPRRRRAPAPPPARRPAPPPGARLHLRVQEALGQRLDARHQGPVEVLQEEKRPRRRPGFRVQPPPRSVPVLPINRATPEPCACFREPFPARGAPSSVTAAGDRPGARLRRPGWSSSSPVTAQLLWPGPEGWTPSPAGLTCPEGLWGCPHGDSQTKKQSHLGSTEVGLNV